MIRRRDFILGVGATVLLGAPARQASTPVIGYLDFKAPQPKSPRLEGLRAGLADAGFIQGKNVAIEYRWASRNSRLLPSLVADLVSRQVAVVLAVGSLGTVLAAKAATSTIPVVFYYGGDPVMEGIVESLNRPGGHLTGITNNSSALNGKRLDLLRQMVPEAKIVGFLSAPPSARRYEQQKTSIFDAGRALGLQILIGEYRRAQDYMPTIDSLIQNGAQAMILGAYTYPSPNKIVSLAAFFGIPAIYPDGVFSTNGGLMSYDADDTMAFRRLGKDYVAPILKGTKPADIPVQMPTKFVLTINLKTAEVLGLTVPPELLSIADEVIE
jgi:putative tryptophan/tyrosine transport system substrate-binding protein